MLSISAAEFAQKAPWLVLFPGIAISLVVFASNLLGDAVRDKLDPRLRGAEKRNNPTGESHGLASTSDLSFPHETQVTAVIRTNKN